MSCGHRGAPGCSPSPACPARCVTPPSREVTRGEVMNEARSPPGLGHHCPVGLPKDPPDGGEWGSPSEPAPDTSPPLRDGKNTKENGIFPCPGVLAR